MANYAHILQVLFPPNTAFYTLWDIEKEIF